MCLILPYTLSRWYMSFFYPQRVEALIQEDIGSVPFDPMDKYNIVISEGWRESNLPGEKKVNERKRKIKDVVNSVHFIPLQAPSVHHTHFAHTTNLQLVKL